MSLPIRDSQGRIHIAPAGIPFRSNAGLSYDAQGRLCTTTTVSPGDVFLGGFRIQASGHLVIGPGVVEARPYLYQAGLPYDGRPDRQGVLIVQTDVTPAASDPYLAGIRCGLLGGVYATTSVPA